MMYVVMYRDDDGHERFVYETPSRKDALRFRDRAKVRTEREVLIRNSETGEEES